MKKCRKCGVELIIGENWTEARKKCSAYICKDCSQKESNKWIKANPDKVQTANKRKYQKRKKKLKFVKEDRMRSITFWKENKGKHRARQVLYKLKKKGLVPENLTKEDKIAMEIIYEEKYRLEIETNIKYEVHHIIPINDGGLHHPNNLKILTADEHRKLHIELKRNK